MGWFGSRLLTAVGFMAFSALLWHLLAGFSYRLMFAAVPVLFAVQITLCDALEGIVMSKVGWRTKWFTLIIAPGTILHELCHLFAALATGCTVTKAALFRPNPSTGVLGYVAYTQPDDRLVVFREFLVGFAPFFGCGLLLVAVGGMSGFDALSFMDAAPIPDVGGFADMAQRMASSATSSLSGLDLSKPSVWFLIYLQMCFTFGAAPSTVDFKGALSSLYRHIVSAAVFLAFAAFVVLASQNRLGLGGYEDFVQSAIGAFLGFTLVVMTLSCLLMAAILPVLYFAVKVLELEGTSKTIPLTAGFLACYYGNMEYGRDAGLAAAACVSVVAYLLLRWTNKPATRKGRGKS
ncbi:MAG: hypothetical protein V1875_06160 [Candidatus Altiarchaeota archaeon]